MSLTINLNSRQVLSAQEALEALALSPRKRFRLLKDLGRYEIRETRARIRQQKDVDGQTFEAGKTKKKVLLPFARGLEPYVLNNSKHLVVTWKNRLTASKANVHQQGITQRVNAGEFIREQNQRFGEPKYDDPATQEQAKALRRLGFKAKVNGRNKRMTKAEILQRFRQGQAGLYIRLLRSGSYDGKQSWNVVTPKREFLGSHNSVIREKLLENIRRARS